MSARVVRGIMLLQRCFGTETRGGVAGTSRKEVSRYTHKLLYPSFLEASLVFVASLCMCVCDMYNERGEHRGEWDKP